MLKPYSIVEERPDEVTYEFKTIYLWVLYGILIVGGVGLLLKEPAVGIFAGVCMLIYFFTVSLEYRKLGAITKQAAMTGSVRYSGSKWSFKKPLRISVTKTNAGQDAP